MSHFAVLVIGENVEEQLAPFQENNMGDCPTDYLEFEDVTDEVIEKWNSLTKEERKEYGDINEFSYKYFGYIKEGNKYGNYYNPNSKWDWYVVGGRWAGELKLKKGRKGFLKEPSCLGIYKEGDDEETKRHNQLKRARKVDSAYKKDIDFSEEKKEYKEAKRFWELYIEEVKPKNKEEEELVKSVFYKREYFLETYKNKETYAKCQSSFHTFAVLKDGEWFEQGQMGYFGCSSETPDEELKWKEEYFDKFIKDLPEDTLLTIIDAHI